MANFNVNQRVDRLIDDLRGNFGPDAQEIEPSLQTAAHGYHGSKSWKTIPTRLADELELPPISGEIEGR